MKAAYLAPLFTLALLAGCGQEDAGVVEQAVASESPANKPTMTVTSARAERRVMPRALEVQGQIAPWQEAIISARVSGTTLVSVDAQVGDRVKRGQVIARFDTRTVNAELAQARANLAQSQANEAQALANLARVMRVKDSGAISSQDLQLNQTQADMAKAQREMAEAQLQAQEIRLQDCEVRAVDDGVISSRSATLGQVAQPGSELFRLIRKERLEWRAELNAQQLAQIKKGMIAEITLPEGHQINGTIRQLAPALDDRSRLGIAYVDIKEPDGARAGMFASGMIRLAEAETTVVPSGAVVLRDGRSSVFRIGKGDKVEQVQVETGRRLGKLVEISNGISPGDVLAVAGAGFLADGDRVRLADNVESDHSAETTTGEKDATSGSGQ